MRAVFFVFFAVALFVGDGFCGQDVITITQQKPKQQDAPPPPPEAKKEKSLLTKLDKHYSFEGVDITLEDIDCSFYSAKSCHLYYSMQNNSGTDISSINVVAEMINNGAVVNSAAIIKFSMTNKRVISSHEMMQHMPFTDIELRLVKIRR